MRNGSGVYTLPAGNPVVTGTTISSTWANGTLSDISTALTQSIAYDGQTTPVANLPMGGFAHTGVANATARTQYATAGQVEDGTLNYLTSVSGTNAIVATAPVSMSAYVTGQTFRFIAAGANTGAVTLNLNAIGAKSVVKTDGSALVSGDIASGGAVQVIYDGTNFQLLSDSNGASETVTTLTATTKVVTPQVGSSSGAFTIQSANTTAMTVDSSQNVGIGTTSPITNNARFSVKAVSDYEAGIAIGSNSSAANWARLDFKNINAASPAIIYQDQSGALGIRTDGAYPITFQTNGGNERMRIDSSGNVLIGTTNTSVSAGAGLKLLYDNTGANSQFSAVGSASTNTTFNYWLYSTGASAFRFYVGLGGTVYATSTTITGISDQRLKENIKDLDDGLNAVMALKPRKFDWKEGKGKDIKGDRGFIAQEFETVFPDMIEEWADPAPEGEEPYKAVNANLIPTLVKAIQELNAKFEEYKASHP